MAQLPIFQTANRDLTMLQTRWASELNPVISNPLNLGNILQNIQLSSGTNTINHLLGRKLQGWKIIRQRGPASVYDNQDNNQHPELTLVLISSASVSVDLEVI